VIALNALFPAGRDGAFDHRILLFDVVDRVGVEIIRARAFWIKAELLVEEAKDVIDDAFLVLVREHPDAEILRFVLFVEFLAGEPKQGKGNFIAVFLMVAFGEFDHDIAKERSVGHLDGGF